MTGFQHPAAHQEARRLIDHALKTAQTELDLSGLRLRYLPEEMKALAPQLTRLDLSRCRVLETLSGLENFQRLESLNLSGCVGLSNLSGLGDYPQLQSLDLSWCDGLSSLSGLGDYPQLQSLDLSWCHGLSGLSDLGDYPQLQSLNLSWCLGLSSLSGLGDCPQLQLLNLNRCAGLSSLLGLGDCPQLHSLNLSGCGGLSSLSGFGDYPQLQSLNLTGCNCLSSLSGLGDYPQLQSLDLSWCRGLSSLSGLGDYPQLQSLDLSECHGLSSLSGLGDCPQLQSLNLSGCDGLSSLSGLGDCPQLQSLNLSGCAGLSNLSGLGDCPQLQSLNLIGCDGLSNLSGLGDYPQLQSLNLSGCDGLSSLSGLGDYPQLQSLSLSYCRGLSSLSGLGDCPQLQSLNLCGCAGLTSLSGLGDCSQLQSLDLSDCRGLSSLSGLGDYPQLQSLDLSYCPGLSSLSGLGDCPQLQSLNLSYCRGLSSLSGLGDYPQLQSLDLSYCRGLSSLSGLGDCPQLQSLSLIGCAGLSSLSGLTLFPQLSRLTISHVSGEQLSWSDAKILLLERPRLAIDGALPIEHVPPELTSPFKQKAIEDWYHEIKQHGYQTPNTLKVMLLGNGRIGKTQLARRLRGEAYDDTVPSTHGIHVDDFQWQRDDMDVQINCWDFGGQDVYLGTHSLFIDQRAVYVLLWHPGFENNDLVSCEQIEMRNRPLSYWLAYLKSLAGTEANILVCQSQCDQLECEQPAPIPHPQPFQALKQLAFSAKTADGLAVFEPHFKRALQLQSERNGEVWLPNSWFAVEAEIQALRQKQVKQLSYTAFVTLCETHQVAAPETLAGYLHQSGRVFYRRGHFDDQLILDQAWALQGVYLLLERQNVLPVLKESGGCFTRETLKNLLWDQEIEEADQQLFVEMMTQCGACFKIDEQHYLAPDALPEKSPVRFEQIWQQATPDLHIRFEYRFLHDATMRYLLSQIGDKAGAQAYYWRYGCCFYDSQHRVKVQFECALDEHWLQDEVDPFTQPGHIEIQIAGASGQPLAEHLIKSIMEKTHLGQKPTVNWLKGSDNQKEDAMTQQGSQKEDFSDIGPAGVVPDALPNVYFSYAWGDETDERQAVCDEIYQQLSEHDDLNVLRDRNVMKAGDSIEAFERQIGRGDFIVLLVSEKSLRSIDCMHELAMIYGCSQRQRDDFVQRVIPVVLSDAKIGAIPDRLRTTLYWKNQKEELQQLVDQVGTELAGTETVRALYKLTEITGCCVDALSWISDLITERQPDLRAQATVEFVLKRIRGRQTADRTFS